jgi:hypothetical protein
LLLTGIPLLHIPKCCAFDEGGNRHRSNIFAAATFAKRHAAFFGQWVASIASVFRYLSGEVAVSAKVVAAGQHICRRNRLRDTLTALQPSASLQST